MAPIKLKEYSAGHFEKQKEAASARPARKKEPAADEAVKPTAFINFYAKDFFSEVQSYPDHIGIAYLRALENYWNANDCAGLLDDDETLRRICSNVKEKDWPEAKQIIFGKWFKRDDNGKWQHEFYKTKVYPKALKARTAAVYRGRAGMKARYSK